MLTPNSQAKPFLPPGNDLSADILDRNANRRLAAPLLAQGGPRSRRSIGRNSDGPPRRGMNARNVWETPQC